jgi:hypothetical protein
MTSTFVLVCLHRPVPPGDVRDCDVQPAPVGEGRVHERLAEVHAATGHEQHPLDEVADLFRRQDGGGEVTAAVTGDEDPPRVVDPDLLDGRVVEELLQGTEAGDRGVHPSTSLVGTGQGGQATGQGPRLVVLRDLVDEAAHGLRLANWVQAPTAHEFAHLVLDVGSRFDHRATASIRSIPRRHEGRACGAAGTRAWPRTC